MNVLTRSEWRARGASGKFAIAPAAGLVLHHSAGLNRPQQAGELEESRAARMAREVQAFHMDRNGWSDIGYHLLLSRGGVLLEGRRGSWEAMQAGKVVRGAHSGVDRINRTHWGLCVEGTLSDRDDITPAQWEALLAACAWLCGKGGFAPAAISGHRDHKATQCPGILWSLLPEVRRAVQERLEPEGLTIRVHGEPLIIRGWLEDGRAWVPLRALYAAMPCEWRETRRIGKVEHAQAELIVGGVVSFRVDLVNRAGTGFVRARDLTRWGVRATLRDGALWVEGV